MYTYVNVHRFFLRLYCYHTFHIALIDFYVYIMKLFDFARTTSNIIKIFYLYECINLSCAIFFYFF